MGSASRPIALKLVSSAENRGRHKNRLSRHALRCPQTASLLTHVYSLVLGVQSHTAACYGAGAKTA